MDSTGEMAMEAMMTTSTVTLTFGSTNIWNPIGWTVLGVMTVAIVIMTGVMVYDAVRSYSINNPDPYARPGQKSRAESLKIKAVKKGDIPLEIIKETVNLPNQKSIQPSRKGHKKY